MSIAFSACSQSVQEQSSSLSQAQQTSEDEKLESSVITAENLTQMQWDDIVQSAKGTTVTFYGWGGDDKINTWITTEVANTMKEKYDITVEHVGMDISEILTRMLTEKGAGEKGSVDVVWINGENFYTAKESDLLFGTFLEYLPNANAFLNLNSTANTTDFGVDTQGMEAPWGRAQLVFFGDSTKTDLPQNVDELTTWVQENPGKFTYPAPPEFNGSAFVRNIIMQYDEGLALRNADLTDEEIATATQAGMDLLNEIKPYLWREGATYPANFAQLQTMYADGEIDLGITYTVDGVYKNISDGLFPEGTVAYTFENGGLSNTHFLSIAQTSPNPAGALVLINELLSVELQASKASRDNWGDLSVLDPTMLSDAEKEMMGQGVLLGEPLSESHASLIEKIDAIWQEQVLN